jgi:hypothetical protein
VYHLLTFSVEILYLMYLCVKGVLYNVRHCGKSCTAQ